MYAGRCNEFSCGVDRLGVKPHDTLGLVRNHESSVESWILGGYPGRAFVAIADE